MSAPGTYRLEVQLPRDHVGTTDTGQDLDVVTGEDVPFVVFGLVVPPPDVLAAMHGDEQSGDEAEAAALAEAADEQMIALSAITSLPLRFAEGRDLMAQVGRRQLGDGLVWLGVPFRSQIDGGEFQFVNCGPASLTMVLAAFGLEVGPSQVRDYLNELIANFDRDRGTSLDVLARIGRLAGLTPMDLYSERGGYRNWSPDAVRWHVQQGHPVITLVKYRNLPGHGQSLSDFDHYVVISGLTPNGFIYNDAAFATTLGYGLEISDVELIYAWENSSIPHHALALGLDPGRQQLTFPETPARPATADRGRAPAQLPPPGRSRRGAPRAAQPAAVYADSNDPRRYLERRAARARDRTRRRRRRTHGPEDRTQSGRHARAAPRSRQHGAPTPARRRLDLAGRHRLALQRPRCSPLPLGVD